MAFMRKDMIYWPEKGLIRIKEITQSVYEDARANGFVIYRHNQNHGNPQICTTIVQRDFGYYMKEYEKTHNSSEVTYTLMGFPPTVMSFNKKYAVDNN